MVLLHTAQMLLHACNGVFAGRDACEMYRPAAEVYVHRGNTFLEQVRIRLDGRRHMFRVEDYLRTYRGYFPFAAGKQPPPR